MKIEIIVPSNNIEELNGFIESFNRMKKMKMIYNIVPILNNQSYYKDQELKKSNEIKRICRYNPKMKITKKGNIIPFADLRYAGMKVSIADYFMFMDDDNRFKLESDDYYVEVASILYNNKEITTLQCDRKRDGKIGLHIQENGFFWTGYSLIIKNNSIAYLRDEFPGYYGCCEETLFAYKALENEGLPYIYYGNPTSRDTSKPADWNQNNNPSYSEEIIQNNIQGYIQNHYDDNNWRYYENIPNTRFPKGLLKKLKARGYNEKF